MSFKRTYDRDPRVHRALKFDRTDPQHGADVLALDAAHNKHRNRGAGYVIGAVNPNGVAGPDKIYLYRKLAYALGVWLGVGPALRKRAQVVVRDPRKRTATELKRADKRRPKRKPVSPTVEVSMNVRNQSSRDGVVPELIVLHSTESSNQPGVADLRSIGAWFDNPAAQASAHLGIDADGNTARYVPDTAKAWHVVAYNSKALGIEQIGRAAQASWPEAQLNKTAQWIAYWSRKYDIPITHSTTRGVCRHSDLGAAGGNHNDPGPAYPLARVLNIAKQV